MRQTVSELDKLYEEVGTYRSTKDYRELLEFIRRFREYAPYNAMLLHMQKPGSKYVATVSDWNYRFGRQPKPSARPLIILRPFGPVMFVYELGDTEGKEFPKELEKPFLAEGNVSPQMLHRFCESLYYSGFSVYEEDFGTELAGFVRTDMGRTAIYRDGEKKKRFLLPFSIVVNKNMNDAAKLATLFHEAGHVYCGHQYCPELRYLPQRGNIDTDSAEFEAESVCWLLCERLGIENPSAAYLSGYLSKNKEIPPVSVETILKAVTTIEQILKGVKTPKQELILHNNRNQQMSLF